MKDAEFSLAPSCGAINKQKKTDRSEETLKMTVSHG